jgi:epoxyqueuosine reductase
VCAADADAQAATRFSASVARGDMATWPYDRAYAARAADPATLLAGARSVVCVAVPYATREPKERPPLSGRISNYAWAADYHDVLRPVLGAIARAIEDAAPGAATRIACDTAPLAERAFAVRAGLAWVGKHTNVIAPPLGSYVFLGEVVTDVALAPDPALRTSCGTCARCVVACPTGALRGDYTIDATRCISDLTQRRGAIPRTMRPLIGDYVWGCDICQNVCPPTRRAPLLGASAFAAADPAAAFPSLQELLRASGRQLARRFRGSAIGWRGPTVLRRNAAVALGNSLDRAAVAALSGALRSDPAAVVRAHAAWALGRIGSPRALSALSQAAPVERSYDVRSEIAHALEPYGRVAR